MKKKTLTREEMISVLIEEQCERNSDDNDILREVLYDGFEGFYNFTDRKLETYVDGIDEDSLEEYKERIK